MNKNYPPESVSLAEIANITANVLEEGNVVNGGQRQILSKDLSTNELLYAVLKRMDTIVYHLQQITDIEDF